MDKGVRYGINKNALEYNYLAVKELLSKGTLKCIKNGFLYIFFSQYVQYSC
jgi:hypothetical protein